MIWTASYREIFQRKRIHSRGGEADTMNHCPMRMSRVYRNWKMPLYTTNPPENPLLLVIINSNKSCGTQKHKRGKIISPAHLYLYVLERTFRLQQKDNQHISMLIVNVNLTVGTYMNPLLRIKPYLSQ